jgi:hypothetical protein
MGGVADKPARPGITRLRPDAKQLLIRGFGVQVPGGAPVLTWGFVSSHACAMLAVWAEVGQGMAAHVVDPFSAMLGRTV